MNHLHTCGCGQEIVTTRGWNNYNKILLCEVCEQKRPALLAQIEAAIQGRDIKKVYIAMHIRHLISDSDLTVEISYRRQENMNGKEFEIVEA